MIRVFDIPDQVRIYIFASKLYERYPDSFLSLFMLSGKKASFINNYFRRFASRVPLSEAPIAQDCQMIIVIPCHNEPDLLTTLDSLVNCRQLAVSIEVIIVVNQSETAPDHLAKANQRTLDQFQSWHTSYLDRQPNSRLSFHTIEVLKLPKKHAGVGLARKTGMDEALRRFVSLDYDGTIICLDADCSVSTNYFEAIHSQFHSTSASLGEVHFEHHYELEENPGLKKGIVNYELFLRYYVQGLKQAGFPNAIHTIGSCMLVKSSTYAKHGGMNKRKAGEDFYFLHKIVPHEEFATIITATVFPSCRTSDRVPFGTGKAQQDWLDQGDSQYPTYAPVIFSLLAIAIDSVNLFFEEPSDSVISTFPEPVRLFFETNEYGKKIDLIRANSTHLSQFKKQFFIWFDGFLCMKFVHFLRDHHYPNIDIIEAASSLINQPKCAVEALLDTYRAIDQQQQA